MPKMLKKIEDYIVEIRKKDMYWLVFNTAYNDMFAFDIEPEVKPSDGLLAMYAVCLNEKFVDNQARNEFLQFMQTKFPNTKLIEVLDLIGYSYRHSPYLGSIAVDCEKDDEVFIALSKKYGNPIVVKDEEDDENFADLNEKYENHIKSAITNHAVFWGLDYENALKVYNKKKENWAEFDRSMNRQ